MDETGKILINVQGNVMEITLNRPAKMNCIGFQMLEALDNAIDTAAVDHNIRVVMITGAGDRAFSTGADLKEFQGLTAEKAGEWIEFGNTVFNKIERIPKPTVALINGYAIGGGLELALACDFRIATGSAVFASVELQHDWLPGWGGMTRLRRLVGEAKAKEIVMLCEKIPADKAFEVGLLTRILGNETENELKSFLDHLAGLKPSAFTLAKTALMDEHRTTSGADVQFDVLAMQVLDNKE